MQDISFTRAHHYCRCPVCKWQFGFDENDNEVKCERIGPGYTLMPKPNCLPVGFECPSCHNIGTEDPREYLLSAIIESIGDD